MAASHLFVPKDSLESEAKQTLFSVRQTMHRSHAVPRAPGIDGLMIAAVSKKARFLSRN